MKIAYLITAYNNPVHLNRLVNAINDENCDIYIHIDKKSTEVFHLPKQNNIHVLSSNIKVYWGSFTFIDAVLLLIREAVSHDQYDYFILLSGACYPVKDNIFIKRFINRNKYNEFINIVKMPQNGKSLERIEYYYKSEYDRTINPYFILIRIFNLFIRFFKIKRSFPEKYNGLTLYGGSTWWGLSSKCVIYILDYIENNGELVKFYRNTLIPEETFFHTIIGNSPFMKHVKNTFTYTDWPKSNLAHPVNISKKHMKIFKSKSVHSTDGEQDTVLFARKFGDNSSRIVSEINTYFRNNR